MRRIFFLIALLAAGTACRPSPPPALDLAHEAALAEYEAPWDLVRFGTVAAEAHQLSGFVWADGHAWAAAKSELLFRWPAPAPRVALLDMAPYPGLDAQAVEVFLNETSVGRIPLEDARRRYAIRLPAEPQQPGRNVLRLAFALGAAPQKPHRLRLAAALHSLAVGLASDATLGDLAAKGTPSPVFVEDSDKAPVLTQVGPSALRFAFAAPADGELRVAPDLHPLARQAGGAATLRVTLEEESGRERELWRRTLAAGDRSPGDIAVRLGVAPGALVRLGLHVDGSRFAWGVWSSPRVLGRGRVGPLIGGSPGEPDEARLAALRQALAGSNVLFVLLDAAGARHLSCYGYARETTPEIDRIAKEGVLFEDAVSPAGFTLLAMGSIWTSQLPDQHHNGVPYNSKLPRGATTLAEVLTAQKVHTAGFVDNVFAGSAYGLDQGFAEFDEIYKRFPRAGAEIFTQVLTPWLEANRERRFFAYLHYREPHFPYNPVAPFNTLFGPDGPLPRAARTELEWLTDVNWKRKTASAAEIDNLVRLYDGNLRYVDAELGALRRALEAAGLWDRTLVIVTADHGDALHEHGFIGHLNQVYQDVTHVPLILRFPKGKGPAGVRVRGLVDLTDVAPTVADVFGVAAPSFRGRSLLAALAGAPAKEAIVSRTAEDQPKYALRGKQYKLIYYTARGEDELYDLLADPAERDDLSARRPVRAAHYRQALQRFLLQARRGPRGVAEEVQLTPEQKENLKALGYVQ